MRVSMLVLASGRGTRLGASVPKAFVLCRGRPLILWTLARLAEAADDDHEIVLAVHAGDRREHVEPIRADLEALGVTAVVDGGATRQESMVRAFQHSHPDAAVVLVHDAARPFPPRAATREAIDVAVAVGAAVLAVPAPDTLKRVDDDLVTETLDRSTIWLAQTPQVIRRDCLAAALERADRDGYVGTDDVSLCEYAGQPVAVVPGTRTNLKVTTPDDLVLVEALLAREAAR